MCDSDVGLPTDVVEWTRSPQMGASLTYSESHPASVRQLAPPGVRVSIHGRCANTYLQIGDIGAGGGGVVCEFEGDDR